MQKSFLSQPGFSGVIHTFLKSPVVNGFSLFIDSFILSYTCLCVMIRADIAKAKLAIIVCKSVSQSNSDRGAGQSPFLNLRKIQTCKIQDEMYIARLEQFA